MSKKASLNIFKIKRTELEKLLSMKMTIGSEGDNISKKGTIC